MLLWLVCAMAVAISCHIGDREIELALLLMGHVTVMAQRGTSYISCVLYCMCVSALVFVI